LKSNGLLTKCKVSFTFLYRSWFSVKQTHKADGDESGHGVTTIHRPN